MVFMILLALEMELSCVYMVIRDENIMYISSACCYCRKITHSFISFLFHVPATLKDYTVLSCALMQEVWPVKIYATFG